MHQICHPLVLPILQHTMILTTFIECSVWCFIIIEAFSVVQIKKSVPLINHHICIFQIYDIAKEEIVVDYTKHDSFVTCCCYSPDGERIASSADNKIQVSIGWLVWNSYTPEERLNVTKHRLRTVSRVLRVLRVLRLDQPGVKAGASLLLNIHNYGNFCAWFLHVLNFNFWRPPFSYLLRTNFGIF